VPRPRRKQSPVLNRFRHRNRAAGRSHGASRFSAAAQSETSNWASTGAALRQHKQHRGPAGEVSPVFRLPSLFFNFEQGISLRRS